MGGYVRVLGPLAVEGFGGSGSSSLGRTQRRLLAMLCAEPGSVVSIDRLREGLGVSSDASVRSAVSRVRALVGDSVSQVAPGYLIDPLSVDSQRFVDLIADAGAAEPAVAVGLFDAALSLWRGSAFEEFADEEEVAAAALWLDEARVTAREDRIEALIAAGTLGGAVGDSEKLAADFPLRERPCGLLMRALAFDGRRVEALRVFNNFCRFLGEEVGVEPTDDLRHLEQAIATGELTSRGGDRSSQDSSAAGPPTGVVTFLFSDVEEATQLWALDREAMSTSRSVHDRVLRKVMDSNGGHVFVSGGDSSAAAFTRASDAVTAASQIQALLQDTDWPGPTLAVRIGLHLGEAEERDGRYFGSVVNTTARVQEAAHGGQVLLTEAVRHAAGVDARFLGQHRLKDLQQPLRLFQLGESEFPALLAVDERMTNLPVAANELVGREDDLQLLSTALDAHRLVTLTGVGGVGKTRLAEAAAFARIEAHLDGVWSVELAKCSDTDTVLSAVATALGVVTPSSIDDLVGLVRGQDVLLLLDNCEHVLDEVCDLAETLLRGCARLRILATSREGTGLGEERVVVVRPLASDEARLLFLERSLQAGSTVDVLSVCSSQAIVEICHRLDGIPLAIELAAATTRVLSPSEIAERLDERFVLLRGSGRSRGVERHQTLRAAVDWSYERLTDSQQRFLRRLGVFVGGVCLPAAEFLAADLDQSAITLLTDLVDRSLLVVKHSKSGARYELLETLRQYALDRLVEGDELAAATHAHAQWCRDYAVINEQSLSGPEEIATIWKLSAETANFRVAIEWALGTANTHLAIELMVALADVVPYDGGLADLCGPVTASGVSDTDPCRVELLFLEYIRRTSARQSGDNRGQLALEMFETTDPTLSGIHALAWGLAAQVLGRTNKATSTRLIELGRSHPDPLQRVHYLLGAVCADPPSPNLSDVGALMLEASDAAIAAGATRHLITIGMLAGMRTVDQAAAAQLVELSEPGIAVLSRLPKGSLAASGLRAHYTDSAIRAEFPADQQFAATRGMGPVLRGDYDRTSQSLARLVGYHDNPALAVRALGASVAAGRSAASNRVREATLDAATETLGAAEVDELLRLGASQDRNDLYREMWAYLEPFMADAEGAA